MCAHSPLFSGLGAASTVDSFSFLILAFVRHAYPAFVLLHLRFSRKEQTLLVVFAFFSLVPFLFYTGPQRVDNFHRESTSPPCAAARTNELKNNQFLPVFLIAALFFNSLETKLCNIVFP